MRQTVLLGLTAPRTTKNIWTPEEDGILREYYPVEGELAFERIPGRTVRACQSRVSRLKIGRKKFGLL